MQFLCWKVTLRSAIIRTFYTWERTCPRSHDKLMADKVLGYKSVDNFLLPPHTFLLLPGHTITPINWWPWASYSPFWTSFKNLYSWTKLSIRFLWLWNPVSLWAPVRTGMQCTKLFFSCPCGWTWHPTFFYTGVKSRYAREFHTNTAQKTRERQNGNGETFKDQEESVSRGFSLSLKKAIFLCGGGSLWGITANLKRESIRVSDT